MSTSYPTTLPAVPVNRWNAEKLRDIESAQSYAITEFTIDAETTTDAEARLLAWIDNDYDDDLRGATATGIEPLPGGRWRVQLRVLGEF
ncbi:hypothetical protein [Streptomyces sp. NPDC007083]|uniref:hypothetical protein n=1 Tax=Streptomyces sp. NPDC007083 TaxID=3156913 RepID=UPI00340631C2